jgi:hypothetical protein
VIRWRAAEVYQEQRPWKMARAFCRFGNLFGSAHSGSIWAERQWYARVLLIASVSAEQDTSADGVLDKGLGTLLIDGIGGSISGAVSRSNDRRF